MSQEKTKKKEKIEKKEMSWAKESKKKKERKGGQTKYILRFCHCQNFTCINDARRSAQNLGRKPKKKLA
jgi:hypothetical protein